MCRRSTRTLREHSNNVSESRLLRGPEYALLLDLSRLELPPKFEFFAPLQLPDVTCRDPGMCTELFTSARLVPHVHLSQTS